MASVDRFVYSSASRTPPPLPWPILMFKSPPLRGLWGAFPLGESVDLIRSAAAMAMDQVIVQHADCVGTL